MDKYSQYSYQNYNKIHKYDLSPSPQSKNKQLKKQTTSTTPPKNFVKSINNLTEQQLTYNKNNNTYQFLDKSIPQNNKNIQLQKNSAKNKNFNNISILECSKRDTIREQIITPSYSQKQISSRPKSIGQIVTVNQLFTDDNIAKQNEKIMINSPKKHQQKLHSVSPKPKINLSQFHQNQQNQQQQIYDYNTSYNILSQQTNFPQFKHQRSQTVIDFPKKPQIIQINEQIGPLQQQIYLNRIPHIVNQRSMTLHQHDFENIANKNKNNLNKNECENIFVYNSISQQEEKKHIRSYSNNQDLQISPITKVDFVKNYKQKNNISGQQDNFSGQLQEQSQQKLQNTKKQIDQIDSITPKSYNNFINNGKKNISIDPPSYVFQQYYEKKKDIKRQDTRQTN
ncbi:hypothetical protein PPERSA_06375 [Pseudocohnilembus persalinus]|uniref:Uncharacterized protein n=1 Tax=Pseudocohnilembus persalinus TaxID=266149 RepID=A0A0V0QIX3_PSEPJ|nr:hypothetical protein PPERSA_06375 [Pseudocohnilembus persalinus]|eukprot:KRX02180.1 hypothetical protein PPERSA_06375 [Pseudocohnilembus persalinus]